MNKSNRSHLNFFFHPFSSNSTIIIKLESPKRLNNRQSQQFSLTESIERCSKWKLFQINKRNIRHSAIYWLSGISRALSGISTDTIVFFERKLSNRMDFSAEFWIEENLKSLKMHFCLTWGNVQVWWQTSPHVRHFTASGTRRNSWHTWHSLLCK